MRRIVMIVFVMSLVLYLPFAFAEEEGIVPILCANGDLNELGAVFPGESATFPLYASVLAEIIRNDTSLNLRPILVGSIGEFVEYLAYPQTYVGVISLYDASLPGDLQGPMIEQFGRGVGLVGINDIANIIFAGNVSKEILPAFANMTSPGQLAIVEGKIVMGHTYVKSDPTHPIAQDLPDEMSFSDVELFWSCLTKETKVKDPPKPPAGTLNVVYKVKEKKSCYEDGMVPAVIAYENVGRSVTFPAVGLNERGGPGDYSAVVYDPNFQTMFKNCVRWAAESGKTSYQQRMDDFNLQISMFEDERAKLMEEASDWKKKSSQRRMIRLALFTVLGLVAIGVVYRVTFVSSEEE